MTAIKIYFSLVLIVVSFCYVPCPFHFGTQFDRVAPIWTSAGVLAGRNLKLALTGSFYSHCVGHVATLCTAGLEHIILHGEVWQVTWPSLMSMGKGDNAPPGGRGKYR